jgi:EmrB/QacA subfamily drug resistance transporter
LLRPLFRHFKKEEKMNTENSVNPWRVFWLTSAAVFLVSMDATILFAAFPAIQQTFPASTSAHLSWVLNAYTIVFAALLVAAGRLADVHGHRRIFLLGVGVFTIASALCGLSSSPEMLIAARVLQAVGAALLTPASLALVLGAFPAPKRPIAVALWGAVGALAAAVGPSVGSYIVDQWGWQYAFYINAPIGLITVVRGYQLLQEQRTAEATARPDVVGILLLIFGVGLLSLGVVQSDAWGIFTTRTVSAVLAGVLLLLAFVIWSRRSESPALDLSLFKNPTYSYVNLATFCFGITFTMMFFGFFMFLTKVWGYSLSLSGLAVTPGPLMVIPVAIITGKIAARVGHRTALVGGGIVFTLGAAWLHFAVGTEPRYLATWLPGMLLTGLGVGMVLPSLSAVAAHSLPPNRFGVGIAVNTAIRQIGSVFGVAVTVVLVGGKNVGLADFQMLYVLLMIGGLATAALCLPVNTRPRLHVPEVQPIAN